MTIYEFIKSVMVQRDILQGRGGFEVEVVVLSESTYRELLRDPESARYGLTYGLKRKSIYGWRIILCDEGGVLRAIPNV